MRFVSALGVGAVMLGMLLCSAVPAKALPISVTETVSGSSGNWTLDYTVTNNMPFDFDVYFFGVKTSARDIVGSPSGWNPDYHLAWSNAPYGGSSIVYNNIWIELSFSLFPPGGSIGGFSVHSADVTAPTNVPWFAIAVSYTSNYYGGDNFGSSWNPGFEGNSSSGVPEPASMALLAAGLAAAARFRRKRQA